MEVALYVVPADAVTLPSASTLPSWRLFFASGRPFSKYKQKLRFAPPHSRPFQLTSWNTDEPNINFLAKV